MGLCWLLTSLPTIIDRESHLGLFLLGKAMLKLKGTQGVEFYITHGGLIGIKQESFEYGKKVDVYLTLEQFEHLQLMVEDFKDELNDLWNKGVEVDDE